MIGGRLLTRWPSFSRAWWWQRRTRPGRCPTGGSPSSPASISTAATCGRSSARRCRSAATLASRRSGAGRSPSIRPPAPAFSSRTTGQEPTSRPHGRRPFAAARRAASTAAARPADLGFLPAGQLAAAREAALSVGFPPDPDRRDQVTGTLSRPCAPRANRTDAAAAGWHSRPTPREPRSTNGPARQRCATSPFRPRSTPFCGADRRGGRRGRPPDSGSRSRRRTTAAPPSTRCASRAASRPVPRSPRRWHAPRGSTAFA